jgi:hypothetical protein
MGGKAIHQHHGLMPGLFVLLPQVRVRVEHRSLASGHRGHSPLPRLIASYTLIDADRGGGFAVLRRFFSRSSLSEKHMHQFMPLLER